MTQCIFNKPTLDETFDRTNSCKIMGRVYSETGMTFFTNALAAYFIGQKVLKPELIVATSTLFPIRRKTASAIAQIPPRCCEHGNHLFSVSPYNVCKLEVGSTVYHLTNLHLWIRKIQKWLPNLDHKLWAKKPSSSRGSTGFFRLPSSAQSHWRSGKLRWFSG